MTSLVEGACRTVQLLDFCNLGFHYDYSSMKEDQFRPSGDEMLYPDEGIKWRDGIMETDEASDDAEAGSISSEGSSGQGGGDLAERLRVKPARDIWTLEEIVSSLKHLEGADEVVSLLEDSLHEEIVSHVEAASTGALWACWLGETVLLEKLLAAGVDLNATDEEGRTCLHLACLVGSEDCVRVLLDHGADPNRWDSQMKATPLHCAASAKSLRCIQMLLERGANINAGLSSRSPLHYAVLGDSPDCVLELLRSGACPDTPQVFTETPLHIAAALGSATCLRHLLAAGAAVSSAMGTGRATALHLAAEDGHAECASLLLDAGADINCINYRKQTPLHLAALAQSVEVVEMLVEQGADVAAQDGDGRTPLHGAIVKGARSCDVARLLLDAGANPNQADNFGYTPMHIAALNEFSACVCLLLDYSGDVTLRTNGGVSVLSFIVRRTPDVVPRYLGKFDDAVQVSEQEIGDVDCELKLDFRILVPCLARGETELMLAFIDVGRKDVLKHSLVETFLFLKWRRIRKFFIMSFAYHAVFVILFSVYVLGVFLCKEKQCAVSKAVQPLGYPIILLNVCFLLKEIFQACHNFHAYIKQYENWLQWLIIIGVFLCGLPRGYEGVEPVNTRTWQHHIAAITIFFSWLELMLIVGRFPTFGLYVQMFTTVTVNFATFLMAYCCLLIAFSLSFSVLFANYMSFDYIHTGILKTVIMMSGELEYEDIFYNNQETSPIQYPVTAHTMFMLFVILVTVILTNLLVGLAVSDIQALQESAGLDRLVRQAQLVAHLESMLFSRLLHCAPRTLLAVLRRGALLTTSRYRSALCVRPNDPRENRIPKDLIASVYKLVAGRKDIRRSIRKTNYEFVIKKHKDSENKPPKEVNRKSNLYDRYSNEGVERRKRTSSGNEKRQRSMSFNLAAMQDLCLGDVRSQLQEMSKKMDKWAESTNARFNAIEQKLEQRKPIDEFSSEL